MTALRIQAALQQQQALQQALATGLRVVIDCSYASGGEPVAAAAVAVAVANPPATAGAKPAAAAAAMDPALGPKCISDDGSHPHNYHQQQEQQEEQQQEQEQQEEQLQEQEEQLQEQQQQQHQEQEEQLQEQQQQQREQLQEEEVMSKAVEATEANEMERTKFVSSNGESKSYGSLDRKAQVAWGLGGSSLHQEREVRSLVKQIEMFCSLNRR